MEAYHIAQIQKQNPVAETKKEENTDPSEPQEPQKKSPSSPVNNARKTSATEEKTPSFAVQNVGTNGTTENETEILTEIPTQNQTNFPTIFRRLNGTKKSAPS